MKTQKKTKQQDSSTHKNDFIELKNPWVEDYDCYVKISEVEAVFTQEDVDFRNTMPNFLQGQTMGSTSVTINTPFSRYTVVRTKSGGTYPDKRSVKELKAILSSKAGKVLYG